jgi:hypothetical protein
MTLNCPQSIQFKPMEILKFSTGNAKLGKRLIFSLPAGYACPNAGVCKTMADRTTGKIMDLPQENGPSWQDYRCFAAMAETRPNVRDARWHNWDLIRSVMYQSDDSTREIYELLEHSIGAAQPVKETYKLLRIHESGDFWTQVYFNAWLEVARNNSHMKFYAYTKSLGMWYEMRRQIPDNMYLTASVGGTLDYILHKYPEVFYRVAYVVYTEEQAEEMGLDIDHDDSHCFGSKSFALLVHNVQRKGSAAQAALTKRRKENKWTGYKK